MKYLAIILLMTALFVFSGCQQQIALENTVVPAETNTAGLDVKGMLRIVESSPDVVDPQCTSGYYTIALNVFDRLVEVKTNGQSSEIVPSLARSWEISDDGLVYTFHLQPDVKFSNGEALTSSDVLYTIKRLLTHPKSVNRALVSEIMGTEALRNGETDKLEGFRILNDLDFEITLRNPYSAFLACLSTPGASILDEKTTEAAGERFGYEAEVTIGTGPFLFREWKTGTHIILTANHDCWSGEPACSGIEIQFNTDTESQRIQFIDGKLDILDLEKLSDDAEFFIHGDIYQERLVQGPRVGISYVALNESVAPLDDVRVRKALQMSLDRHMLLQVAYSGRGQLENGIFPHGLIGFNPDIEPIRYDPEAAKALLEEAGLKDGFDLEIALVTTEGMTHRQLVTLIGSMFEKIGVRPKIEEMDEETFISRRKQGGISCYTATWSADYNDPDNFIGTFFGSAENSISRSICYSDADVIGRIDHARAIVEQEERLAEYKALEEILVRDQAVWIPLYSRQHYFIVGEGVKGFTVSWNGWSSTSYKNVSVSRQ
ncbi:MAG: ABC transporter substrate-binding protein [Clostridia bacterium]|nr:ABC transporter substrate-binding protein [Clostridia bacterium]